MAAGLTTSPTYDSAQPRPPILTEVRNLWAYRGLLRLLVVRDITVRYKRSILGMWWTLLNPLLTTGVFYIIFSNIFRFEDRPGEPYIIYLLSGIMLVTFFQQAVVTVGGSIVGSASVLSKVYVPAEVFSLSAATAAAVNFLLSAVPLLLLIVILPGASIAWTIVFAPVVVLAMLAFTAGLGLIVASVAVRFYDVIDLTNVLVQLVGYLSAAFYPLSILDGRPDLLIFIQANPVYHYLLIFRNFVYTGQFAPLHSFVIMGVTSVGALALGVWVFSRSWRTAAVNL